jgi:hypothetical protein
LDRALVALIVMSDHDPAPAVRHSTASKRQFRKYSCSCGRARISCSRASAQLGSRAWLAKARSSAAKRAATRARSSSAPLVSGELAEAGEDGEGDAGAAGWGIAALGAVDGAGVTGSALLARQPIPHSMRTTGHSLLMAKEYTSKTRRRLYFVRVSTQVRAPVLPWISRGEKPRRASQSGNMARAIMLTW